MIHQNRKACHICHGRYIVSQEIFPYYDSAQDTRWPVDLDMIADALNKRPGAMEVVFHKEK